MMTAGCILSMLSFSVVTCIFFYGSGDEKDKIGKIVLGILGVICLLVYSVFVVIFIDYRSGGYPSNREYNLPSVNSLVEVIDSKEIVPGETWTIIRQLPDGKCRAFILPTPPAKGFYLIGENKENNETVFSPLPAPAAGFKESPPVASPNSSVK